MLLASDTALYGRNPALYFLSFGAVRAGKAWVFRRCVAQQSQQATPEVSPAEDQGLVHPAALITPIKPQRCLHSMYLVTSDFQKAYYFSVV